MREGRRRQRQHAGDARPNKADVHEIPPPNVLFFCLRKQQKILPKERLVVNYKWYFFVAYSPLPFASLVDAASPLRGSCRPFMHPDAPSPAADSGSDPPPAAPALDFAFALRVAVAPALELGYTHLGRRRVIAITGGTVAGPRLNGVVLPGGADWQVIRGDGVAELEARYMLQADDGGLIAVVNRGLRHGPDAVMRKLIAGEPVDPGAYYFRCTPVFETAAPAYHWLTRTVFVASGARHPDRVEISVYAVR